MTQTETLKLAISRLEWFIDSYPHDITVSKEDFLRPFKEALAQPELCKYGQERKSCTSSPMDCQCVIDAALAQPEQDKERCVGCEACIDTACGRDECPKGWPKAAQPEQEPAVVVDTDPIDLHLYPSQRNMDAIEIAGLTSAVGHLSAIVDEQRAILVEVERVCGVDGHSGLLEDGESELIDRVRAHLAMTTPPQPKEHYGGQECLDAWQKDGSPIPTAQQSNEQIEPVAWRHSLTGCLFETEEEVPLADGDEWAEPLYTHPPVPTAQPKELEQEPVKWIPIEQPYPQTKSIDILMGDGSILCAVLPQFNGDLWWEGSGTGEKFIDPKYANVTHWRIHGETTTPPQRKPLTDEQIIASNYPDGEENGPTIAAPDFELICFARQIEAAHGIKE